MNKTATTKTGLVVPTRNGETTVRRHQIVYVETRPGASLPSALIGVVTRINRRTDVLHVRAFTGPNTASTMHVHWTRACTSDAVAIPASDVIDLQPLTRSRHHGTGEVSAAVHDLARHPDAGVRTALLWSGACDIDTLTAFTEDRDPNVLRTLSDVLVAATLA